MESVATSTDSRDGRGPALVEVRLADDPAAWRDAGFTVDDAGGVVVGPIRFLPGGAPTPAWTLVGPPPGVPAGGDVDGVPTAWTDRGPGPSAVHANGIAGVDHVVVRSPDVDRTTEALGALGAEARRTRDVPLGDRTLRQRFFWLGPVILELVGEPAPTGDGPASLWGVTLVADDLDATASSLGDRCSPPKDAVQRGRRIATLDTGALGISIALAVMTPHA